MSWKHWAVVLTVIGFGIVLQITGHEEEMPEHGAAPAAPAPGAEAEADVAGPYRTVTLEITGMT